LSPCYETCKINGRFTLNHSPRFGCVGRFKRHRVRLALFPDIHFCQGWGAHGNEMVRGKYALSFSFSVGLVINNINMKTMLEGSGGRSF